MMLAAAGGLLSIVPTLPDADVPLPLFEAGLFLVGFFTGACIVPYAVAKEPYPKSSGLSIGFLGTCYHVGCGLSQPLSGYRLELHSKGRSESTLALPSLAGCRFSFTSLVFFMGVGLLTAFMIKDSSQER